MKLFRKKGVTQPVEKSKSKTPYQEGEAFIRAAKEFEKSLINPIKIERFLDGISGLIPREETIQIGASK